MNIQEIERQLGIPRANIRYYEREGLLHPERGPNNYRIYTSEDVEALKKIRLLRQLDMPIETIRAVQAGDVPLADAVARQERLLENEAVKLEQSRAVCRSILEDRVSYAALEPARYEQVRPALPALPKPKRPPVEGAEWALRPWQRFWARGFDLALAEVVVSLVLALLFHCSIINTNTALFNVLTMVLSWALTLAVEPLLLCTWGTTPGKWLLGLELRTGEGRKLSYSEGLERTWGVLGEGFGYCLPVYTLYRQYRSYHQCRENELMEYDQYGGYLYYSISPGWWSIRAAISLVLQAVLIVPVILAAFQVVLPPNRGDVTQAELFENINRLAEQANYSLWLDSEGYELAGFSGSIIEDGKPPVYYNYGQPFDDEPVYTVETDENGYVTAVMIEAADSFSDVQGDWPSWDNAAWLPTTRAELMIQAFAGTSGSGIKLAQSPLLKGLSSGDGWDGTPVSAGGFTRIITLEMEGCYNASNVGGLIIPEEGAESGWYRFEVRLEKEQ